MKHFILIFICFFLFVSGISDKGINNTILWSSNYKLKWTDFEGIPPDYRSNNEQCVTKARIEVLKGNSSYQIPCYFEKEKSWTINDSSQSLLEHEQRHFDIAEMYARNLRKQITEIKNNPNTTLEKQVSEIYHHAITSCIEFQKKYDEETDHSKNEEKQIIWNNRIKEILIKTNDYSSISVTFKKN